MDTRFFYLLLFSLSWEAVQAQLNESDTVKFQLRASVTGAYQQGNVELLSLKARIDYSFLASRNWVFKSQNNSLYQTFYAKEADKDIFSRNYLYYKPQLRVYPFAIAYIATNLRRKIAYRYFAGAGVTVQVINTKNTVVKLSGNAVYERTKFKASGFNYTAYDGNNTIAVWRGTIYSGGWTYLSASHLRFFYEAYWQPAFNNKNNYRTQLDAGIDLPVWKGLSMNAVYAFTHENVTVKAINRRDKILTFGAAYSFKVKGR